MTQPPSPWDPFLQGNDDLLARVAPEQLNYLVNISLQRSYIYVETPKVACSSIKVMLQRLELNDPALDFPVSDFIHLRAHSPLLAPVQVGRFRALLDSASMFRFAFVRDPYARLLSAYLNKIAGNTPEKKDVLNRLGLSADILETPVSFAQFISVVEATAPLERDLHWREQTLVLQPDIIRYDFIGRFEQFDRDIRQVFHRIGPDAETWWHREDRHGTGASQRMDAFYTPDVRARVHAIYAADFETFGYPP